MSDQMNDIDNLFRLRTNLVSEISQTNAEHMRILQLSSGIEVLLMNDHESTEAIQNKSDVEAKISSSLARLEKFEAELAKIDSQIEMALNKEAEND